ncbi:MAG: hypothetical protein U1F60_07285 [Planctomycetota bacterium]
MLLLAWLVAARVQPAPPPSPQVRRVERPVEHTALEPATSTPIRFIAEPATIAPLAFVEVPAPTSWSEVREVRLPTFDVATLVAAGVPREAAVEVLAAIREHWSNNTRQGRVPLSGEYAFYYQALAQLPRWVQDGVCKVRVVERPAGIDRLNRGSMGMVLDHTDRKLDYVVLGRMWRVDFHFESGEPAPQVFDSIWKEYGLGK